MFQIIDTHNNHLPVKSRFITAAQAYTWAKKNLPKNSYSKWGKMNYFSDRYFIQKY